MKKAITGALAALTAIGSVISITPASAQNWRYGNYGYYNRHDYNWHRYNDRYGYSGYVGRWREGDRFRYWDDSRYYVDDWGAYDLPPPRRGYRYYRDDNGDIVMAAIGSGIIGMVLGSELSEHHRRYHRW